MGARLRLPCTRLAARRRLSATGRRWPMVGPNLGKFLRNPTRRRFSNNGPRTNASTGQRNARQKPNGRAAREPHEVR